MNNHPSEHPSVKQQRPSGFSTVWVAGLAAVVLSAWPLAGQGQAGQGQAVDDTAAGQDATADVAVDAAADAASQSPGGVIGQAIGRRLESVLPVDSAPFVEDAGWSRYVAEMTSADLKSTWALMPTDVADRLAGACLAGRTLLLVQPNEERVLAVSMLAFDGAANAKAFVQAGQSMSLKQFAQTPEELAEQAAALAGEDAAADEENNATANESAASSGGSGGSGGGGWPVYEGLRPVMMDVEGADGQAMGVRVTMAVPGSPPVDVQVWRASSGQFACELLFVHAPEPVVDAATGQPVAWRTQVGAWLAEVLGGGALPLDG